MRDEIKVHGFQLPSKQDLIFEEIANLIDQHHSLSQVFKTNFVPNANQKRIREVIETSQVPDGEPLHILLFGGVGSGKTWGALSYALDTALSFPGVNVLACRRTSLDLKTTVFKEIEGFFGRYGVNYYPNQNDLSIKVANESTIFMRSDKSLVQAKKSKSDALGGTYFSVVLFEEADSLSEELVDTIPGRMRQRIPGFRKVIFYLCNPPGKNHWLYKRFFMDNDPDDPLSDHRAVHCPMEGNLEHLDPAYVTSVTKQYAKNPSLYARLRDGNFAADTKGYPYFARQFNKRIHVSEASLADLWNPKYPMLRCWDFGYRGMALVVMQDDLDRHQLRIFYSFLEQRVHLSPFAKEHLQFLWQKFPGARWRDYADPAGRQKSSQSEKTNFDILEGLGCNPEWEITSLSYGLSLIVDELTRLSTMKDFLGEEIVKPSILFSSDAETLIEAFETGYCNEKEAGADDVPKPVKDGYYEHIMDAFRYGLIHIRDCENESRKRSQVNTRNGEWESLTEQPDGRSRLRPTRPGIMSAGPRGRNSQLGRSHY